ncbi:MAG: phospholipid carrier-dependent glycosyltransferase [Planctomycetota bacterium]|nr:MAG: phospholipid carrier-dependent glycosyltransferase [Planctomycetota bacterium]
MNRIPETTPKTWHRYAARIGAPIALLLLALYLCWLSPGHAANLAYENDEVDYAVSAATWYHTGSYRVPVGGELAPPQYPFGFPLMSLPFFAFHDSIGAPILCVLFCALGLVLLAYSLGRRFAGVPGGILAALLLLSILLFRRTARHVLADVPAAFLMLLVLWCLLAAFESRSRRLRIACLCIASVTAGLAVAARLNAAFVILPIAVYLLMEFRSDRKKALISTAIFATAILAFVIPLMAYNSHHFGSPFRTGYSAWAPWIHDRPGFAFRLGYLASPAISWPPESAHGNFFAYIICIVSFFSERARSPLDYIGIVSTFLTVILGLWALGRNKPAGRFFLILSALLLIPSFVLFNFYFYQNMRFMLPLAPLLAILAAIGTCRIMRALWHVRGKLRTGSLALLFLIVLIIGRFHTRNLFHFEHMQASSSPKYATVKTLAESTPGDALIITSLYPVYVEHLVIRGTERKLYPLAGNGPLFMKNRPEKPPRDREHARKLGAAPFYPFAAASEEGITSLQSASARGKAIYLDEYSTRRHPEALAALRSRFSFEKATSVGGWRIYRLVSR